MLAPPTFARNRADQAAVLAHLEAADAGFVPTLSSRVDLPGYAAKLLARAERFEAWDGPVLIGLVAAYCNMPPSAFITSVSVLPPWQGRGVARELMRQCLLQVRRAGLATAMLEVSPRASAAISLYRALGFRLAMQDDSKLELRLDVQPEETTSTP